MVKMMRPDMEVGSGLGCAAGAHKLESFVEQHRYLTIWFSLFCSVPIGKLKRVAQKSITQFPEIYLLEYLLMVKGWNVYNIRFIMKPHDPKVIITFVLLPQRATPTVICLIQLYYLSTPPPYISTSKYLFSNRIGVPKTIHLEVHMYNTCT